MKKIALTILLTLSTFEINAQDLKGFWDRGAAADFRITPVANSSEGIVFADGPTSQAAEKDNLSDLEREFNQVRREIENKPASQPQPEKIDSRDQILKTYGDPQKDRDLKLEDNAPVELKGLASALNLGDKELAFQYARAYVRYQEKVKKFVDRSVDYQMAALEAERIKPADPDKSENSGPYREEIKKAFGEAERESEPRLTKEAKDILAAALAQHNRELEKEEPAKEDSKVDRIPSSPDGRVQILFFFSFDSTSSIEKILVLKELAQSFKLDPRVTIIGLVTPAKSPRELEALRKQYQIDFKVIDGVSLSESLRVAIKPSIVFAIPVSGDAYMPKVFPDTKRAIEIVKTIQG